MAGSVDTPNGAWDGAANALDLIRRALVFRTLLLLLGIVFVTSLLLNASSTETRHVVDCWLGIAGTLVSGVALVGVVRFVTRAPDGHVGSAGFAPLCLGVTLLAQIYRAWIDIQLVKSDSGPIGSLQEHLVRLPYLEVAASCGALLALWSMIGGVGAVARSLANEAVIRRARGTSVMVGVLSCSVGAFEYWAITSRPDDNALVIWLVLAVFALGVLFLSAGTLAMASDAMRAGPRQILPGARVVSDS